VAFYKKWKNVAIATIIPAIFFIIWDIWFMNRGIWSFNEVYVLGIKPLGLPIEEWLFFAVIPYCSLFVYEVVKTYFQRLDFNQLLFWALIMLGFLLLIFSVIFFHRNYSFYCFIFCAAIITILLFQSWFLEHLTHLTFTFALCLIPMLIVNGILTLMPVVQYNETQIIGLRIYTIPLEDFFYYLLLLVMNVLIYERLERVKE
jgi:lycopene cyclase domain-containing protein